MKITRLSPFSGKYHTMEVDCTEEQLRAYYEQGLLIQQAFPDLTPEEREFIKTGITPEEWDATFGDSA